MFDTIIGCIAELERSLVIERIRQGMGRWRLEGFCLGRAPLHVDRQSLVSDGLSGMSLSKTVRKYRVSRASVIRFVREARQRPAPAEQFQPMSAEAAVELMA